MTVRNDQFLRCNHRTTAVLFKKPFSLRDVQGRNDRRNDTVSKISFDRIQLGASRGWVRVTMKEDWPQVSHC